MASMGSEKTQAAAPTMRSSAVISLDGPSWLLATDPKNVGREQKWWEGPTADAKPTKTPSIIQDVFPDYHGVAWYWRDFTPPANPHAGGRCLLRFWQVDYLADVWVNGVHVGRHEGSEDPFVFDVTDALKPGVANRLAIRVLNPTNEPIDGIRLGQTPRSNKSYPPTPGCDYNWGGIEGNVELIVAPAVRVEDLFVRPDPKTGKIRVQANVRNAGKESAKGHLALYRHARHERRNAATGRAGSRSAAGRHAGGNRADGQQPAALATQRSVPVSRVGPGPPSRRRPRSTSNRPVAAFAISASRTGRSG